MNPIQNALFQLGFRLKRLFGVKEDSRDAVPEMTFKDADRRDVSLSSLLEGKLGGILWLTNLCEDCQNRMEFLETIHKDVRDKLTVVAVSVLGDERKLAAEMRTKKAFTYPLLEDPADEIGNVLKFPHPAGACPMYNLLLFGPDRIIRFRTHLSAVKDADLLEAVGEIISGAPTLLEARARTTAALRWTARLLSAAWAGWAAWFGMSIFIEQGISGTGLAFVAFHCAVYLVSAAVPWFWEPAGGALLIFEGLMVGIGYPIMGDGVFPLSKVLFVVSTIALPPLAAGALFLAAWRRSETEASIRVEKE